MTYRTALLGLVVLPWAVRGGEPDPKGVEFFEKKIRPTLVQHCYNCHSTDAEKNNKLKGGLHLDSRAGILKGGDTGAAIVPGKPDKSTLLSVLRYTGDVRMPP